MKRLISSRFKFEPVGASTLASGESQLAAAEAVKAKLVGGEYQLRNYDCPCGAEKNDCIISEVDRFGLPLTSVVCLSCGTVRVDPYLDEQSLEDFYVHFYQQMYGRAQDLEDYLLKQRAYGTKVLSVARGNLQSAGWVYEVGCGAGGALKVFQEQGYQVAGCDFSEELIEEAQRRGIAHVYHGTLGDLKSALGGGHADLIYLHHVFEHLNDPLDFLETCRKLLSANGRLLITVPDISRIDSFAIPNGDLLVFLHIAHKFNFSFEGLRRLCGRAGYSVTRLWPDPGIRTAASEMPELWVEMRAQAVAPEKERGDADDNVGREMHRYLVRTEQLYSRRLRRSQLSARLSRLSPWRILRSLHPSR